MKKFNTSIVKTIITIAAILNIVVMMGFEYWLPTPTVNAATNNAALTGTDEEKDTVGTIESVAKEQASKETEAAETALARREEEEPEEEPEEERDPDAPILELTDDHIYLKVGERFNYMSYIKRMEDVDGSDLSHYIYLDSYVDTSVPGDYEITYRITSTITGKSDSKVLLVTVEE